jgi:hypothetical protein
MGGGGALLAWPTTAASPQITMEIHISNWTHKFQNKTGLDAKANLELYKSNWVCSARRTIVSHAAPLEPRRTLMSHAAPFIGLIMLVVYFCHP